MFSHKISDLDCLWIRLLGELSGNLSRLLVVIVLLGSGYGASVNGIVYGRAMSAYYITT